MATIPQSIPNLVLWLDGNDPAGTGTPPANSAAITTWVDKSASAASGTATGTPTYQTSFANGRGSIRFPGSAYIQNASYTLTLSSKTFFMVCSSYAATTYGNPAGFMSFGNVGAVYDQQNGTAYQGPEASFNNKFGFLQAYGNGGYYTSFGSPFGETPLGIYGDTQSGTAAIIYVNGTVLANHTLSYTPGTSTQYRIGRRTDGLGQYLYGNVCEVLVYTGILSTTNRQLVEGYLAWKWGTQASLPSGHPYLSAAPVQALTTPLTIPANTSLLLVGTSSFSKTFILPTISTNPGRLLIFKDIYGSFSTSSVFLSTTGLDGFENNASTMRLDTNYGAWTFLNDAVTRWYLMDSYKNTMTVVAGGGGGGGLSATGGTIVTSGFKYHVFTSTSNFVVSSGTGTVNYLVVGGGGGGGDRHGGGGGAGGVLTGTWSVSAGTYTVTVGLGGVGGYYEAANSSPQGAGIKGGNSSLLGTGVSVTAHGGGGGGTYDGNPTGTVGSGGGGGGNNLGGVAGTVGQGNSGGSGAGPGGGGGGGAGGVGANANTSTGGIGTTSYSTHLIAVGYGTTFAVPTSPNVVISGGIAYIAAGGGGAASGGPGPGGSGGLGGGGRGDWNASFIQAGTANTGGGGGGSRSESEPSFGRDGGSGLVLLWY